MDRLLVKFIVISILYSYCASDKPCRMRTFKNNLKVCVCNAAYCDEISKIEALPKGQYVMYTTTMSGKRFFKKQGTFSENCDVPNPQRNNIFDWILGNDIRIEIKKNEMDQKILGFGGAFTDSAGMNIKKLSKPVQRILMSSYFGENGIEYNMGRVPIGGTDFSTHKYAYNEYPINDKELSNFTLTKEDYKYKIPYIQEAINLATDKLYLLCSTWSPPPWMKDTNTYVKRAQLLPEYYQTYADYHLKFLKEYLKHDISFWGITNGNEGPYGIFPFKDVNCLGWLAENLAHWIAKYFGPTLKSSFPDIAILVFDDARILLPWWLKPIAANKEAVKYIDGISVHWYMNDFAPPSVLRATQNLFPKLFLLATEASFGHNMWEEVPEDYRSWAGAERYVTFILEDLNNLVTGWIDWNLVLSQSDGPSWSNNSVDCAINVNPREDEFYKTPIFYAMGHFSKFIPRGSVKIGVEMLQNEIQNVAFLRPDGGVAVVFLNPYNVNKTLTIVEKNKGHIIVEVSERSFSTLVYWQ